MQQKLFHFCRKPGNNVGWKRLHIMEKPTLNTLLSLLDKLSDQVEQTMQAPDGVSLLEKDRLKETLRQFYDAVDALPVVTKWKVAENATDTSEKNVPEAPVTSESVVGSVIATLREQSLQTAKSVDSKVADQVPAPVLNQEAVAPATISGEVIVAVDPVVEQDNPVKQEPILSEQPAMKVMEAPVIAKVEQPAIPVPAPSKSPVEDKVIETRARHLQAAALFEEQATVAAKYSAQETLGDKVTRETPTRRLSDQLKATPLADLKSSIGINERFAFINELFAGDQQSYFQSIEHINRVETYEDARRLIHDEWMQKFNWKPTSERFLQFDDLVKRRFNA